MDNSKIEYIEKVCSGDTLTGLGKQVDGWHSPGRPSIATLSNGGNGVGFSDLVSHCVVTPATWRWGSTNRANCETAITKAQTYISDPGTVERRYKLKEAYLKILRKSGGNVRNTLIHQSLTNVSQVSM